MKRVVVVGASHAGVSAVEELRKRGFGGEVVLVGAEAHLPYSRPPLSKEMLADTGGSAIDTDSVALHPLKWYQEHAITLRLGQRAGALDTVSREVALSDGSTIDYDGLVVATGVKLRRTPWSAGSGELLELRTKDDALRLAANLPRIGHLVVVGAGFIGMEVAAAVRKYGIDVTVVDVAGWPMSRAFGEQVGSWFSRLHEANGVRVLCSTGVEEIHDLTGRTSVRLAGGEVLTADAVLVGIGTTPATDWLTDSGLELDDGVVCDTTLATGAPGVVVAGDIARWINPRYGSSMRVEHWTNAIEQGAHAVATLLGDPQPYSPVPYLWTDQFDARTRCVGVMSPDDETAILTETESSLVAVFGRAGRLHGAVCVNAPRELVRLRQAIAQRAAFDEIVPARSR
jgi:NADPH-dependent 2,4-dienoyl-CoA reductase/sulfur reductase-like enzyme